MTMDVCTNVEWRRNKSVFRGAPQLFLSFQPRFVSFACNFLTDSQFKGTFTKPFSYMLLGEKETLVPPQKIN